MALRAAMLALWMLRRCVQVLLRLPGDAVETGGAP